MKSQAISLDADRRRSDGKKSYSKGTLSEEEKEDLEALGLNSFVKEYKKLRNSITEDDFAASAAAYQLLRAQLSAVVKAIAVSDKAFLESGGRNAYAYVAVHNLARELAVDLRTFSDQSESVERTRTGVIQPMLSKLATDVVSRLLKVRKKFNASLPAKVAKQTDEELRAMQEDLTKIFVAAEAEATDRLKSQILK